MSSEPHAVLIQEASRAEIATDVGCRNLTCITSAAPPSFSVLVVRGILLPLSVLVLCTTFHSDARCDLEARREQPGPPISSYPETAPRVCPVEITTGPAGTVVAAARPVQRGCQPSGRGCSREQLSLHLAVLLDKLPGDHPEDLLDALARLGTYLMARVPSDLLAPEPRAPLRSWAAGLGGGGRRVRKEATAATTTTTTIIIIAISKASIPRRGQVPAGRCSGRGRGAHAGSQVFGDICDTPFEGHLTLGGVPGDDIRFCADDMKYDIVG